MVRPARRGSCCTGLRVLPVDGYQQWLGCFWPLGLSTCHACAVLAAMPAGRRRCHHRRRCTKQSVLYSTLFCRHRFLLFARDGARGLKLLPRPRFPLQSQPLLHTGSVQRPLVALVTKVAKGSHPLPPTPCPSLRDLTTYAQPPHPEDHSPNMYL